MRPLAPRPPTGSNGLHGHCSVIRFVKQMYSVHTERSERLSYTLGPGVNTLFTAKASSGRWVLLVAHLSWLAFLIGVHLLDALLDAGGELSATLS